MIKGLPGHTSTGAQPDGDAPYGARLTSGAHARESNSRIARSLRSRYRLVRQSQPAAGSRATRRLCSTEDSAGGLSNDATSATGTAGAARPL